MSDRWALHQLEQCDLKLTLLPGIGGRLWDIQVKGQSLLFQNPDLVGSNLIGFNPDLIETGKFPSRSPQFPFPLWGGEKTWIAPDTLWQNGAPFQTLDSGPYEVSAKGGNHIDLTSGVCPISQLSLRRSIKLNSAETFSIEHLITNHGPHPRTTGVWSVMMMNTPAKIGVPMKSPEYKTVFGNPEMHVKKAKKGLIAECAKQQEFKVGLPNPEGETFIKFDTDGPWLSCSVAKPNQQDQFAHHYPTEIFQSGDYAYCEAEWHSPQVNLKSGQTLVFKQGFRIWAEGEPYNFQKKQGFLACMS